MDESGWRKPKGSEYIMRAIRGAVGCAGAVLVLLAACASEWEPAAVLAVGLSGLALCCIAKGMAVPKHKPEPEHLYIRLKRAKKKAAGRAGTRTDGKR